MTLVVAAKGDHLADLLIGAVAAHPHYYFIAPEQSYCPTNEWR